MLSQFEGLGFAIDGRYASDEELQFITDYVESFDLHVQTYLKLQELESTLVQQAYLKLRSLDPTLFNYRNIDISAKWRLDTIRVLRYVAVAVLINDPETLRRRFLLWFRSIMQAFETQRSCDATYQALQVIIRQHLPPAQANLVCPILELTRSTLGIKNLLNS